jgi:hypothetical protein
MTWNMARNTEKCEKGEIHSVESGIFRKYSKTWKMRNAHCRTWNMASNTEQLRK